MYCNINIAICKTAQKCKYYNNNLRINNHVHASCHKNSALIILVILNLYILGTKNYLCKIQIDRLWFDKIMLLTILKNNDIILS